MHVGVQFGLIRAQLLVGDSTCSTFPKRVCSHVRTHLTWAFLSGTGMQSISPQASRTYIPSSPVFTPSCTSRSFCKNGEPIVSISRRSSRFQGAAQRVCTSVRGRHGGPKVSKSIAVSTRKNDSHGGQVFIQQQSSLRCHSRIRGAEVLRAQGDPLLSLLVLRKGTQRSVHGNDWPLLVIPTTC
ncbi:hypothetical protein M8818_007122 [Zalaria obscura]|uniref:Uncharacterized protein n=1 Tax=Zalaria obscura TaxID=2024903 RepID=A0ACC3S5W7_9PEZI